MWPRSDSRNHSPEPNEPASDESSGETPLDADLEEALAGWVRRVWLDHRKRKQTLPDRGS